jgi:hypothetical protein
MRIGRVAARVGAVGIAFLLATGVPLPSQSGWSLTALQYRLMSGGSEQALVSLGVLSAQAASPGAGPNRMSATRRVPSGTMHANVAIGGGGDSAEEPPLAPAPGTTVGGPVAGPAISGGPANVVPARDDRCSMTLGGNVKVNQDCLNASDPALHGRAQAQNEPAISMDPSNPSRVIAASNDYRRGDGGCGAYFSQDGGKTWGGGLAPSGFTIPGVGAPTQRQYWQAGGDTAVGWDASGTAYLQCQVFNRGLPVAQDPDVSSGVLVFRSDNGGASWNFTGRPVILSPSTPASGVALEDKPYMAVDSGRTSPFSGRVYVSWTEFRTDGTAPILLAYSSDHGQTFSKPVLVSTSSSLCPISVVGANNCDANQFSEPVAGPDGSLQVVWANYDNAVSGKDNRNQMLVATSHDGGATFSAPVKVADYYDLPDCVTYTGQDAGRACVPVKNDAAHQNSFFRATNYPSAVVDPKNARHVIVDYGSYINRHSNESNGCVPTGFAPSGNNTYTGVTTPGACNNDIQVSESWDGGKTFTGTTRDPRAMPSVNKDSTATDQWWQWTAITSDGTPAVSFYDRQYGSDERSGYMDVSLVAEREHRVTSSSIPPVTEFGGLFLGDYTGISAANDVALPIWADNRAIGVTSCPTDVRTLCSFGQDEDVFTARVHTN